MLKSPIIFLGGGLVVLLALILLPEQGNLTPAARVSNAPASPHKPPVPLVAASEAVAATSPSQSEAAKIEPESTARTSVNEALQALRKSAQPQQISVQLPRGDWEVLDLAGHRSLGREGEDAQWTGKIKGQPGSMVVVTRWKGAVFGSINARQGAFEIRACDNGALGLYPVNDMGCDVDADGVDEDGERDFLDGDQDDVSADGGSLITIVIAYNQQAANALGGAAALEAKILTAVEEANESYAYCSINLQLGLAWLGQINYPYSESQSFTDALNGAIDPDDGQADELAAMREEYGADFASLWLASDVSGGLAKVLTSAADSDSAYHVVRAQNPTNTFIHELGHNMGCRHLKDSYSGPVSSWYIDSYANVFFGNDGEKYITVMGSTSNANDENATRIPYFSGPSVVYEGVQTGSVSFTDCAQTLRFNRMVYADFRKRTPVVNTLQLGSTLNVLTLQNVMVGEHYFLDFSSDLSSWSTIPAGPANNDGVVSSARPASSEAVFYRWKSAP